MAAIEAPQAGHQPTDRAQQRWQAWIPQARQVVRRARVSVDSGSAGFPHLSQNWWSIRSVADSARW